MALLLHRDTSNLHRTNTLLKDTHLNTRAMVPLLHHLKAMGRVARVEPHTEGIYKVLQSDQVGRLRHSSSSSSSREDMHRRPITIRATHHPNNHRTELLLTVHTLLSKDTLHLSSLMGLLLRAQIHSSKGILPPNSHLTEHHRPKANTHHSSMVPLPQISDMDNLHHYSKTLMVPHPKRYLMELRHLNLTAPLRQCRLHLRLDTFLAK